MKYGFIRSLIIACAIVACLFVAVGFSVAAPANALDEMHPAVQTVISVQDEVTPALLQQAEILGTAVGIDAAGNPLLSVYVDRDSVNAGAAVTRLPREVRGIAVRAELVDQVRAMGYTGEQTPMIWPTAIVAAARSARSSQSAASSTS